MKKSTLDNIRKLLDKDSLEIVEVANMGNWLEARIHSAFTNITDDMFGGGYLTRAERISLSAAFGLALDSFNGHVEENIPQIYKRRPYQDAPEPGDGDIKAVEKKIKEPAILDKCVKKIMKQGKSKSDAFAICQATLGEGEMPKDVSEEILELARKELKIKEAEDLETDFVPLLEKSVRSDGTIPIKIIEPGWGTSGYYSPEVLERDGPEVFVKGIKLFWNHPTMTEDAERPERDLHDLAAELIAAARWVPDHPSGAGLYGEAKVFTPFQDAVDELSPHIGVSIRAKGKVAHGQAEGKAGPIVKEITAAKSVDFVTEPGAGGQILQLFEAQRNVARKSDSMEVPMDEKEVKKLQDANEALEKLTKDQEANLALLNRRMLEGEASDFVAGKLVKVEGLPQAVRSRLLQSLAKDAPVKEGKIDEKAYDALIKEAVQAELKYLSEVTGGGEITGMGSKGEKKELTDEQSEKALEKAFARMGLEESTAKVAAAGR